MGYQIEQKLVVAVASSALFDLTVPDGVFRSQGEAAYRAFQREHENEALTPGTAFPFVQRLLGLNQVPELSRPVEVVLLSHNDADTGLRVMNSVRAHQLEITRGSFCGGLDPFRYMTSYGAVLYLSDNSAAVEKAMSLGHPAGRVLRPPALALDEGPELRIAFDFDGVLADDSAEAVYQDKGLVEFHKTEHERAHEVMGPGPLQPLLQRLREIQQREWSAKDKNPEYERALKIAIITARNAPADTRLVETLRAWGVQADETHFTGGIDKHRFLDVFRPHVFFDDQIGHLDAAARRVPSVHVPFGVANRRVPAPTSGTNEG